MMMIITIITREPSSRAHLHLAILGHALVGEEQAEWWQQ